MPRALLVLLLMASATPLAAQRVRLGPLIGASWSSFGGSATDSLAAILGGTSGNTAYAQSSRRDIAWGGFVELEFGRVFALEPQLLAVRRGATWDDIPGPVTFDVRYGLELDYIQVPVLVKAEWRRPDRPEEFSVFAGPAFSFLQRCRVTDRATWTGTDECTQATFAKTDVAVVAGLGLEYRGVSLQARYEWGLKNAVKETAFWDIEATNKALLVTLGYGFAIN